MYLSGRSVCGVLKPITWGYGLYRINPTRISSDEYTWRDVPRVCYFFAIPVERVQNRTDSTILNIAFQGNLLWNAMFSNRLITNTTNFERNTLKSSLLLTRCQPFPPVLRLHLLNRLCAEAFDCTEQFYSIILRISVCKHRHISLNFHRLVHSHCASELVSGEFGS